jgi:hypothetical protein
MEKVQKINQPCIVMIDDTLEFIIQWLKIQDASFVHFSLTHVSEISDHLAPMQFDTCVVAVVISSGAGSR